MILQIKNVSLLLVAQLVSYLIPIIEIPILAKALGVDEYGHVLIVQTTALLCSLVVEYGFSLSGSRQIALCSKDEKRKISKIYSGIISAKILLSASISIVMILCMLLLDFDLNFEVIIWGYLYFLAFSFSAVWLFQGFEKLTFIVLCELFFRFSGLLVLYMVLGYFSDASVALMVMSTFALINTFIGILIAKKMVGSFEFDFNSGVAQIKSGFHGFIYKSSNNIMLSAGPALVGVMCGQAAVAKFAPAEKIIKASVGLVGPVLIGLYPFLSRKLLQSSEINLKLSSILIGVIFFLGVLGALIIYGMGEYLIDIMLGSGFGDSVTLLNLFVLIIPFRMMNQAIGLTVFMPLGKDRILSSCFILFSMVSLVLAGTLSVWMGLLGIVSGFVCGEVLFSISLVVLAINIK
ncbi:hypothetical protein CJF35_03515 [Pseudomonas lundensis]|uniref:oligosaccharide flippase family protein n=1 Tax=Pseudomonas lundensis TaxID=86185 RepID=UPI000BA2056F|nr:oligosaccharide flippase family protein [Pseudomonas lundensis]OZY38647.1 hypothetical protein CJF35_03515 [Pseudomonas lundensis]